MIFFCCKFIDYKTKSRVKLDKGTLRTGKRIFTTFLQTYLWWLPRKNLNSRSSLFGQTLCCFAAFRRRWPKLWKLFRIFLLWKALGFLRFKGYLRCKIIFCHKLALDAQLMNCFIWEKMFRSGDIQIFVFLWNSQISKYATSSKTLLHNEGYTFAYFFWILSTMKMKLGQILACCMTNISNMWKK